ncbi:MAG: hypothetical protein ACE37D_10555, partial [Pseudomonadales bacterium]
MLSAMLEKGLMASTLLGGQLLLAPLAAAGPEGGVVVSGQGSVTRLNALDTKIDQQSQNLLMNFDSFDLNADESVLISQPNAAAWFVGQIVGGSYDANASMWAARVWWMLRWIGFDDAALLDGG